MECDKRFQTQLLEQWRQSNDIDEAGLRVHRRQVCQPFGPRVVASVGAHFQAELEAE